MPTTPRRTRAGEVDGSARNQGTRAARGRGMLDDTKQYVSVILQLYGSL